MARFTALIAAATLLAAAALAAFAGSRADASGAGPGVQPASVSGNGGTITWETEGGHLSLATRGEPGSATTGTAAPVYYASIPAVSWDGHQLCFTSRAETFPSAADAAAVTASYGQTWALGVSRYPACPGVTAATSQPVASPALVAASWWRAAGRAELPRPDPAVAPGYALAGKAAYLEARLPLSRVISAATPLGPLTVWATARVWVDWGDGAGWTGPFATAGQSWPLGTLTHAYTSAGQVDVAVRATWSALWSLDGATGTLTSLQTTGSIGGFQVRQLESVRDR